MRMDKLTSRFQQALADAQSLAVGRDNNILEPVHVLAALLDQQGGSTAPLLTQAQVNVPALRQRIGEILDRLPRVSGQEGNISLGNDLNRLLNLTDKLAQQRGDQFIASELFVLAALEDRGEVGGALKAAGATKERVEAAIEKLRGGEKVQSENAEEQRQALEKYTIDLTERAESRQARSRDRSRRGNPPHDPGTAAPDQEQPGADRRARRRQDRHRRRPGAAHRQWRSARRPARQARALARHGCADRGREIPR